TGRGFDVTLGLRAGSADESVIRSAIASGRSYVETSDKIVLLDADKLRRLGEAQRILGGETEGSVSSRRTQRVSAARAVELDATLEALAPGFQPPATWKARSAALRNLSKLSPAPLPPALDLQLRLYQRL